MRILPKVGVFLILLLLILFLGQFIFEQTYSFPKSIKYGVTFSPGYATYLGLDWKQVFINSLDELKIRNFRIPTYWDTIEKEEGKFDFQEVDFMLSEVNKRQAKVILVLGFRQPRWPECYIPAWAKNLRLEDRRAKVLEFISKAVERYKQSLPAEAGKDNPIVAWQVENEPFLPFFGENCDEGDKDFLQKEVNLVRSMSNKPVIISDSGELGSWIVPMQLSDIFGTSVYRKVYNSILGYTTYPILPFFYNLKSQIIRTIFAPNNQKTIIVELQTEPWIGTKDLENPQKQAVSFSLEDMETYIKYGKATGFDTAYLWGVEWWYFMAKMGHPEYLEYAKSLFNKVVK